jgi:F0F1-type ATP synthase alpha subunit
LFEYFNKEHPELIKKLRKEMEINTELDKEIDLVLKSFNKQFGEEKE